MKKLLLILFAIILSVGAFAQGGGANRPRTQQQVVALPFREVSGVVKDTADNTIIGASIKLVSKSDTLYAATNADGVFVIKNVKQAVFVLTVTEVGNETIVRKYLNNDAIKRIVLEPIVMHSASHELHTVTVNGTPSITYKTDTVEYKASDYKVHANATVDELLKKMEGMEVGSDGSLTHQGQQVMKARLNGKDYAGGAVAQAIQNLPADIVEKIQIVDDYGDQAARTGIKDGDPQKVLNITTRADRSVGTTGRLTGQYGSDDRYNAQLFVQRINANQQLGVIGRIQNTVNGVASTGVTGGATNGGGGGGGGGSGTGGTTQSGQPSFNYRDQWGKKVQVIASYSYNFRNVNSTNNSFGSTFGSLGTENYVKQSQAINDTKGHNINFQMEITPDSADFIQITPTFGYSSSDNNNSSQNQYDDYYKKFNPISGLYENDYKFYNKYGSSGSDNSTPNYGMVVFYQHLFKKVHRNASIQVSYNNSNNQANSETNNQTLYYTDVTRAFENDSLLLHYKVKRNSVNKTYRASATYVEPISLTTQFEFNAQIRRSQYDNTALTDSVLTNNTTIALPARSNVSDYSFTESRGTVNYRFNGVKYNISLGTTFIPSTLQGTKLNSTTGTSVPTTRTDFRVIPVFRFSYSWSRTQRFTIAYSGANTEPTFTEIQSFTDLSNPQNPIVGNPDLKPAFTHTINTQYNNYIANSKLNISLGVNTTFLDNEITTNNLLILNPTFAKNNTYINETHYVNLDGAHSVVGRYNFAKQLDDRKYNLSLNGNITYGYDVSMSNNIQYSSTTWRFDERFGPRINPNDNIEINPYIGYDLTRSFFTQPGSGSSEVKKTYLAVDGKMYFLKTWQVNYSVTKSYVTGLGSLSTNPTVINAGFQKEFFQKKNFVLTFDIFDLLHQNNFVEQTVTANSINNTQSNALSRYFMLGFRLNLQKWSGTPTRNGKQMMRRGDGSFIY